MGSEPGGREFAGRFVGMEGEDGGGGAGAGGFCATVTGTKSGTPSASKKKMRMQLPIDRSLKRKDLRFKILGRKSVRVKVRDTNNGGTLGRDASTRFVMQLRTIFENSRMGICAGAPNGRIPDSRGNRKCGIGGEAGGQMSGFSEFHVVRFENVSSCFSMGHLQARRLVQSPIFAIELHSYEATQAQTKLER